MAEKKAERRAAAQKNVLEKPPKALWDDLQNLFDKHGWSGSAIVRAASASAVAIWDDVTSTKSELLGRGELYGALIGKIGGSSADIPDGSQPTARYGSNRVFAIGRHWVISLSATGGGELFLTMNDNPEGFANHSGARSMYTSRNAAPRESSESESV